MDSIGEYLTRTESAVRHIFAGVDAYLKILSDRRPPVFVGTYQCPEQRDRALAAWMQQNEDEIQEALEAERKFVAEKYALAILCGSLLQVAAMAIRLFSRNETVPEELKAFGTPGAVPYCMGRVIRGVPLGLVVYAGRNQSNHADEAELRAPSCTVFEWLTTKHTYGTGIRDPAFDLGNRLVWNYASNVTSLIEWRAYGEYERDMRLLLEI